MVNNLKDVMRQYADEQVCRDYLVQQRWNGKPVCPYCGCDKSYRIEKGKRFKCGNSQCYKKYSVTVGTVFEASNIPLSTWFPAMYLISAHKKGISSVQLAKDLGVTQKSAWFMLHRIREALKENHTELLDGVVEVDETYMSRKFGSEYQAIPPNEFVGTLKSKHKGAVIGIHQRGGKTIAKAFDARNAATIKQAVTDHVATNAMLMTDESKLYRKGLAAYHRSTINHSAKEWTRGIVHTNNIEAFFGVMKRGIYGTYHQISFKHLQAYCDEFSYRHNSRGIKDGVRFTLSLQRIEGRLTYKQLVYGKGSQAQETGQKEGE